MQASTPAVSSNRGFGKLRLLTATGMYSLRFHCIVPMAFLCIIALATWAFGRRVTEDPFAGYVVAAVCLTAFIEGIVTSERLQHLIASGLTRREVFALVGRSAALSTAGLTVLLVLLDFVSEAAAGNWRGALATDGSLDGITWIALVSGTLFVFAAHWAGHALTMTIMRLRWHSLYLILVTGLFFFLFITLLDAVIFHVLSFFVDIPLEDEQIGTFSEIAGSNDFDVIFGAIGTAVLVVALMSISWLLLRRLPIRR